MAGLEIVLLIAIIISLCKISQKKIVSGFFKAQTSLLLLSTAISFVSIISILMEKDKICMFTIQNYEACFAFVNFLMALILVQNFLKSAH